MYLWRRKACIVNINYNIVYVPTNKKNATQIIIYDVIFYRIV